MSSELYYKTEDLPKADPTMKEELDALKAQMAKLVTALQDATDRTKWLERQLEAQKEILNTLDPVFAATTEERQRIEALEQFNMGHVRFYHAAGWKTPAFVPKAHILGIFNKK